MKEKIEQLKLSLNNENLLSYEEGEHYYIVSENDTDTFILIQKANNDVIIWSYETKYTDLTRLIDLIETCFMCTVIFPFVDSKELECILKEKAYVLIDFQDDDVDEDEKKYPSYMKVGA